MSARWRILIGSRGLAETDDAYRTVNTVDRKGDVCDVFLSHNRHDRELVRDVAEGLELEFGIRHFLDDYAIPAGEAFVPWIESALTASSGCAIFLGQRGWGPTHLWEAEKALQRFTRDPRFKLIPVILGEASEQDLLKLGEGAVFKSLNWVHFPAGPPQRESLEKLRQALTGEATDSTRGPAKLTPYLLRREAFRWHETQDATLLFRGQELLEAQKLAQDAAALAGGPTIATFLAASAKASTRRAWKFAIASFAISLALVVLTLFATNQMLVAQSRELVTLALANEQYDRALLLADAAYRTKRTAEARRAFFTLLTRVQHVERYLHGYPAGVRATALSQDGKRVAAGGEGGQVFVWDLDSPAEAKWTLPSPDLPTRSANRVHALAFVALGAELVAAYEWGGLRIWNLQTKQWRAASGWPQPSAYTLKTSTDWEGPDAEPPETRGERPVTALGSVPADPRVVAGDFSGRLFVVDVEKGVVERQIQSALSGIEAVTLLVHEDILLAGDGGGKLDGYALHDRARVEFSKQPHDAAIVLLSYDDRALTLLTLDRTGKLVWWKQKGRRFTEDREVRISQSPVAAEMDPSGVIYVTTRAGPIYALSAESGEVLGDPRNGHRLAAVAIRCAVTGGRCASGGVGGEVIVWNNGQWHPLRASSHEESELVVSLRRTQDRAVEIFTQPNGQLTSAEFAMPERKSSLPVQGFSALAAQDDGNGLAVSFSDGRVEWRDSFASPPTLLKTHDEHPGGFYLLAISKSGRYVAGVAQQPASVFVWDRWHLPWPIGEQALAGFVSSLAFSPDERSLIAGDLKGSVMKWSVSPSLAKPEARPIAQGAVFSLAFLPDGHRFIAGSGAGDRRIRVLDSTTLKVDRELPERHTSNVSRLAVAPDGSTFISASDDGSVVLWDAASWQEIGSFSTGLDRIPQSIVFDGETAYVAGDRQVSSWQLSEEHTRSIACRVANRTMLEQEWQQFARGIWPRRGACEP